GHDRANGRIFRVSSGETKSFRTDLQKLSDEELVKLLASRNSWHARHAQRILQERASAKLDWKSGALLVNALGLDRPQVVTEPPRVRSEFLRQLWTYHATRGGITSDEAMRLLQRKDELVRAWT